MGIYYKMSDWAQLGADISVYGSLSGIQDGYHVSSSADGNTVALSPKTNGKINVFRYSHSMGWVNLGGYWLHDIIQS
jgi:hypothetical protein